ncbi:class I SAM-dependent methyltransferase [Verrucosispora sp. WMMA2044]|uniref:class I SAM-dependent methyltransferase n=1 Tax=Verrucosispora sp. WMMA2044 TaxID=3016419 RepID=UPI00248AA139|nr:class I SAM-dependent methyltransferase [Verrucosispora sp. WMMA2044]WBB48496.1 class I SAM-dependent methyltransferase [Verrucosispora sp. WMMA2044]
MTITSLSANPGPVHLLLDPVIRTDLDRIDIRSHQSVLEIGASPGEITARLAQLVGRYGSVTAVDHDTSHLTPTSVIDVQQRDLDRDLLPGTTDSYDHIVARWPYGSLRDPVDVLEQMIARLRPDGWLLLADIIPTPPRIHRTPADDDTSLIDHMLHQIHHALTGPDGTPTWTSDIATLLVDHGMVQHCVHTTTETWTGNGPGCRLLADIAAQLHPTRVGITDTDIDRFTALMTDPRVLLASYERRVIHASKSK